MSTTSGRWVQVNRFAPGGRLGNDLKVGLGAEHRGEPGTNQFLVVGDQYPHGHNALMPGLLVCVRGPESRTCRAGLHVTAIQGDPLTHADQTTPGSSLLALAGGCVVWAVVDDFYQDVVGLDPHGCLHRCAPSVSQRVGERLLQHAVGREIDTWGDVGKAAFDV